MEAIIGTLHAVAISAGFGGVVLVAFVQEVFPPLPSTLISASLGFLLFAGKPLTASAFWELFVAVGLPIAIGLTLGSIIIYYAVAWGGTAIIDRYGRWLGVTKDDIETLRSKMRGTVTDDALLFVGRALPIIPSVAVNIVAGLTRWRLVPFIVLTFLGTIVRAMWSAIVGWQIGGAFERYAATVEHIHNWIMAALVLAVALFIWHRRKRKSRNGTMDALEI